MSKQPEPSTQPQLPEYKHVVFNHNSLGGLQELLSDWEQDGWRLIQIVPYSFFETVAVLSKGDIAMKVEDGETIIEFKLRFDAAGDPK